MKKKLNIVYEDKYLIVVNKYAGLLTISRDNKNSKNLYNEVGDYVKKQNPKNKVFIVHRLDKETSGLVLFAKSEKVKLLLQNDWNKVKRYYIAVVEGKLKVKKDRLVNYLKETNYLYVYVTQDKKNGKLAITNYEVIKENTNYSLLKICIETGRKNQIRVQLANIGHPIVGDKKYNSKCNPINKMALCASRLVFVHPIIKKTIDLDIGIPDVFKKIIN